MSKGDEQLYQLQDGIGATLRKARTEAELSVADVARRLHMSASVIQALEAEDWSRLGAPVFVRGQLRSYARMLGLPVDDILQGPQLAPVMTSDLKPRTYTAPVQRFAEQAARRVVYIVLTVAILVPVWLATRPHIVQVSSDGTPLDAPVNTATAPPPPAAPPDPAAPRPPGQPDGVPADTPRQRQPIIASMAPIPQRETPALELKFSGDSWVQIIGADGNVVESGLLKSGEQRRYGAGEIGRMVLGNASAVQLQHDGQIQDLTPYLRANVARFTVSSDGSLAPPAN